MDFKFAILLFLFNYYKKRFKNFPVQLLPINNKKIVFSNYDGLGFGCNPKYIAEELLKRRKDLKIYWLVRDDREHHYKFPRGIKKVDMFSIIGFYELCTSKIWIDNYHKNNLISRYLQKREGQYYIQTWHGSLGIKRIESDVEFLKANKKRNELAIKNAKMQDFLISNSSFEETVYKSAFYNEGKILRLGHARNDILVAQNDKIKDKVYKFFKLDNSKHILLYAPTFRRNFSAATYDINYEKLKRVMEEKFGGEWVIMVRLHQNISTKLNLEKQKFVINATSYDDIQELLASSSAMISDYSSCIFDYILTKRPAFIYANDLEKYNNETGFYYPLETTPFSISKNNDELAKNILYFDLETYVKEVNNFLEEKKCIDDGNSSKRIVDFIENLLKN